MSELPIAEPIPGAPAAFTTDLPCVVCGYNLRGLTPGGRCPECGSPVDRSVHGNLLRYADRGWLEKLLLGIRLTLWNILITIVICVGSAIAGAAGAPAVFLVPGQLLIVGIDLVAMFLLTAQEPRIAFAEDRVTLRRAMRACAAAVCLGKTLNTIDEMGAGVSWLSAVAGILSLAVVVTYFGKFVYLKRFALRIPDARLARSTRVIMWGWVIVGVGGFTVGLLLAAVFGASGGSTASAEVTVLTILSTVFLFMLGLGAIVLAIWYLILLFDYRNAFRLAIAEVRSLESQPPQSQRQSHGPQASWP